MSYVLENLDLLVTKEVYPLQSFINSLSDEAIDELISKAQNEKEAVQTLLKSQVFSCQQEVAVSLLIKHYQASLIRLIDQVQHYLNLIDTDFRACNRLYVIVIQFLEELLSLLQKDFSKYFNLDQKVSDNFLSFSRDEMAKSLLAIEMSKEGRESDPEWVEVVFPFFNNFLSDTKKATTYRELNYRKELINEISEFYSPGKTSKGWQSLKELLIYFNFNHASFFNLYCQQIAAQTRVEESYVVKLDLLRYHRKMLLQTYSNTEMSLYPQLPAIQEQVSGWINEELVYLESKRKTEAALQEKEIELKNEPKISLNLSVAQLGLLIRVFTIDKTILNANQMEVVRFFAGHFRTPKAENIAYGSLYGKYFKPEPSTIKEVKNILLRMVAVVTDIKEN